MRIHLEGMGIQGCLTAHFLARMGFEFTWNDINFDQTAWKASTGAIYPAGSMKFGDDAWCRDVWEAWFEAGFFEAAHLEQCTWWFNHKTSPPHEGRYRATKPTEHGLRGAEDTWSYHFNAQKFVPATRVQYEAQEDPAGADKADVHIVTHGWSLRQSHVYWGWTRLVELDYDRELYGMGLARRPAFYFREGRFIMTYAYPVAGTGLWYAGSHIIKQPSARARSLEIPPKYDKWKDNFHRLGGGAVRVTRETDFIEGWRPAARDDAWVQRVYQGCGKTLVTFRPLWNSGIRHFPQQLKDLGRVLTEPKLHQLLEVS